MLTLHLIEEDIGGNLCRAWTVEAHRTLHDEIADYLKKVTRFNLLYPEEAE